MLTRTLVAAAAAAFLAACSDGGPTGPSAPATGDLKPSFRVDHTQPGTPGAPNCKGQTAAYVAQLHKQGPVEGIVVPPGVGGLGRLFGSVKDVQAFIDLYCAGGVPS